MDKIFFLELGYDERENEYSVPRLVHQSREQTLRYTTPIHNPNTQQLVRAYVTEPLRPLPLSGINRTLASAPNASKYSAGVVAPQNATTSHTHSHRVEDKSLAPSQKPFEIPDPEELVFQFNNLKFNLPPFGPHVQSLESYKRCEVFQKIFFYSKYNRWKIKSTIE